MTEPALAAMLRSWRARPSLATHGSRRVPGLRRQELAELAGVSADYVALLEQGRSTTPSARVVAALSGALQLSPAERDHFFRVAGLQPPGRGRISDEIPAGVRRFAGRQRAAGVGVFAADWHLLWWNDTWAALLGDPRDAAAPERNYARDAFPVGAGRPALSYWPVTIGYEDLRATAAAIVSDLRQATSRYPDDPRLARLIADLTAGNADFARLWAAGTVGRHRQDRKTIHHPSGPIEVDCDVLTDGMADLKVVVFTAEPGSRHETALRAVGGSN